MGSSNPLSTPSGLTNTSNPLPRPPTLVDFADIERGLGNLGPIYPRPASSRASPSSGPTADPYFESVERLLDDFERSLGHYRQLIELSSYYHRSSSTNVHIAPRAASCGDAECTRGGISAADQHLASDRW
ncbi:hypothetical protein D9757_004125 [Collybiopsis confluens]|uniref:Uncharacterized protein n=1 Tax=Collybiopsis confluens TaxID=2823264 RepID=A0A8H5HU54_9AGAR|nr:hypothetical protein D9757_004125 [Collybiopsis confluens]